MILNQEKQRNEPISIGSMLSAITNSVLVVMKEWVPPSGSCCPHSSSSPVIIQFLSALSFPSSVFQVTFDTLEAECFCLRPSIGKSVP